MLAYFWGKWSLGKYDALFPLFLFFLGLSYWRQWKFCYCLQWDNDLRMLQAFKCKLKYRAFSGKTKQNKNIEEQRRKLPTKTQNKVKQQNNQKKMKEKIEKFIAVGKKKKKKEKKGTEIQVFLVEDFFFPCCLYIPCSTLKTGTQDVIPWKQLDTTGFVNYFCQGLDSGDLIFFLSLIDFFSCWNPWYVELVKLMLEVTE